MYLSGSGGGVEYDAEGEMSVLGERGGEPGIAAGDALGGVGMRRLPCACVRWGTDMVRSSGMLLVQCASAIFLGCAGCCVVLLSLLLRHVCSLR